MSLEPVQILIMGVLFVATLIRSAFGFGEALIAVPLLAMLIPVEVASPVAVLVSLTVAFIVMVQDWRNVHIGSAVWLVIPTMLGIPLGLMLLTKAHESTVKAGLATVIIATSAFSLVSGIQRQLKSDNLAWIFGFAAGVLGGAYGMNGPPLVMYGSLRGWSPQHFRATLNAYFLPASLAGMCGYYVAGLWTPAVNRHYLSSLPLVLLATLAGRSINRRMALDRFRVYVHVGLILIATVLLIQAAKT